MNPTTSKPDTFKLDAKREDGQTEPVLVKRLGKCDRMRWMHLGLDPVALVCRSVERADGSRASEAWLESLTDDSCELVTSKALELNYTESLKKKVLEPTLRQFQELTKAVRGSPSSTPKSSSSPEDTIPAK